MPGFAQPKEEEERDEEGSDRKDDLKRPKDLMHVLMAMSTAAAVVLALSMFLGPDEQVAEARGTLMCQGRRSLAPGMRRRRQHIHDRPSHALLIALTGIGGGYPLHRQRRGCTFATCPCRSLHSLIVVCAGLGSSRAC